MFLIAMRAKTNATLLETAKMRELQDKEASRARVWLLEEDVHTLKIPLSLPIALKESKEEED